MHCHVCVSVLSRSLQSVSSVFSRSLQSVSSVFSRSLQSVSSVFSRSLQSVSGILSRSFQSKCPFSFFSLCVLPGMSAPLTSQGTAVYLYMVS